MILTINGQAREINQVGTLADLLAQLQLSPERVVVELNGQILCADQLGTNALSPGDKIELVQFVGGG